MTCLDCNRDVAIENKDLQLCATCNKERRNSNLLYPQIRTMFLEKMVKEEAVCPYDGTPITMDSDIHHMQGRIGYLDDWARQNGITRRIDVRKFLAVNRPGHTWIELHPDEAKAKGWSEDRLS